MSQSLLQLQDGVILISTDNKTYQEMVDYFKLDYLASDFIGDVKEIIYNQTLQKYIIDGDLQTVTSDSALDAVIVAIDDLLAKQAMRNSALTPEPPTFSDLQQAKLAEIDTQTKQHIIGGFISTAKGAANVYDSADADQLTFAAMYAASRSVDFATTEPYNGNIPIRAVPDGKSAKEIIGHNAAEMQKLMDDLALHIGTCKQTGWALQGQAMAATSKEALEQIVWTE